MFRRNVWVLLSAALGTAILCALGIWQLERLAWKEELIAKLEKRLIADPITIGAALQRYPLDSKIEYLKVSAVGTIDPSRLLHMQTVFYGASGWRGLVPFTTADGLQVLVDIGKTDDYGLAAQPFTHVLGVIRLHNLGKGYFDVDNEPAQNRWYWWDIAAMQKAAGMPDGSPALILQALSNESGFQAEVPKVELNNNHMGYAITWFGLAAALLGVTGAVVFRKQER